MFTGLVEEFGLVRSFRKKGPDGEFQISTTFHELVLGESIAVNGACLTVVRITNDGFFANASAETLGITTLENLKIGSKVHLERALRPMDRMGGHIVSGHVDGVGKKISANPLGDALKVAFSVPKALSPLIAPKGAITIDGVSLTVNRATGTQFDVVLVPFTRQKTLLDKTPIGTSVNLEVDILAKYVARLLGRPGVDGEPPGVGIDLEMLAKEGFL